ncbi:MAG: fumarylacetoacetate hydrolase family protein [Bacteroidales bacterium]|nr:fumarylacetoacetate hydrolase family protein [Bacteroidales bacterium]
MKIICIGRNYIEHAHELNNPVPAEPVFFMKPETALIRAGLPFFYPDFSKDVHFEVELVLHICKLGKHISEKFAHTYYDKIGIGIDFTARDVQSICKQKGLPWEIAKAFDGSAPVSKFISRENFADLYDINFSLEKNNETVQKGNSGMMIFNFEKIIAYVSRFVTLKIGDLIFTGTPAGVGPVSIDDNLKAYIEGKKMLDLDIK